MKHLKNFVGVTDTVKGYSSAENITIDGGKGNDFITCYGLNVSINGGAGNDSLTGGNYSTITGGKGNDVIDISLADEVVIKYASGDGKDTVENFDSDDVLHITKGSYSVSTNGDDVVVKVGKGSITLKDAAGQEISIKNSKGKVTTKTYSVSSALFAENNFVTADNLSEIIAEKYVGEFEFNSPEKLTQENLIAYAAK